MASPERSHHRSSRAGFVAATALGGYALHLVAPEPSFAFESAKFAIEEICGHMQGQLGALLMTTSGVGALVAAAFGNFRATQSLIVTAIGAATVAAVLSLYFKDAGALCAGNAGNIQPNGRLAGPLAVGRTTGLDAPLERGPIGDAALAIGAGRSANFDTAAAYGHGAPEIDEGIADFDPDLREMADAF